MQSGFVSLIGRPNAGKSTLLNAVLGQKLAITSPRPQTTRNRLLGIYNAPDLQVALVDTPGIHAAKGRLNRGMVQVATDAMRDVDAVCWVVDAEECARDLKKGRDVLGGPLRYLAEMIEQAAPRKLSIVLNKVDRIEKPRLLPMMQSLAARFPQAELVPLSALQSRGVKVLIDVWRRQLPAAPPVFPPDQLTDATERFLVSELIREKIFHLTRQEIPYSTAVEIEKFEEIWRDADAKQDADPDADADAEIEEEADAAGEDEAESEEEGGEEEGEAPEVDEPEAEAEGPGLGEAEIAAFLQQSAGAPPAKARRPLVRIFARIHVERDSQKGIIIGKGGEMLKRIGAEARREIQDLLECKVYLQLHVSVSPGWTDNPRALRELGYDAG